MDLKEQYSLNCFTLFICGGLCHLGSFKQSSWILFSSEDSLKMMEKWKYEFALLKSLGGTSSVCESCDSSNDYKRLLTASENIREKAAVLCSY